MKRHSIVVHFALDYFFGSIFILNHYMQFSFASMHHCAVRCVSTQCSVLSCALAAIPCFHRAKECFVKLLLVVVVFVCCMLFNSAVSFCIPFYNHEFLPSLCFPLFEVRTQINILCIHNSHLKSGLILFLLSLCSFFASRVLFYESLLFSAFAFDYMVDSECEWMERTRNEFETSE